MLPDHIVVMINVNEKRYVVAEPFTVGEGTSAIIVPEGFYTDFGSVPRGLWNIFPPWDRQCLIAFVVHDYLYFTGKLSRERADDMLLKLMRAYGANWLKAQAIYRGVRLGGFVAYNQHRRRERDKV